LQLLLTSPITFFLFNFFSPFKAMDHLTTFVGECDRKTEAAKNRLAETQEELSAEVAAKAQKVRSSILDKHPFTKMYSAELLHGNLGSSSSRTDRSKVGEGGTIGR
jgi:hypothetical protein